MQVTTSQTPIVNHQPVQNAKEMFLCLKISMSADQQTTLLHQIVNLIAHEDGVNLVQFHEHVIASSHDALSAECSGVQPQGTQVPDSTNQQQACGRSYICL